jgi:hypothetical protein
VIRGVAWKCSFCGEVIVEEAVPYDTYETLRARFAERANEHLELETEVLVAEIAMEVGNGPQSR